jgi:hypothetical protein
MIEKRPILSGIFFAATFLFRFSLILYILPIGVYVLYQKEWKQIGYMILGSAVLLIPWMSYNIIKYKEPLWDLFAQGKVIATYTTIQPLSYFIEPILQNLFPIVLGVIGLIFVEKKHKKIIGFLLGGALLQIALHVFFVRLKLARYVLTVSSVIVILSVYGIYQLIKKINNKEIEITIKAVIAILLLFSLIPGITFQIERMDSAHNCNDYIEETNEYLSKYPAGTRIAANSWPLFATENNFNMSSTWTTDIATLASIGVEKILYIEQGGLYVNKTALLEDPALELEKNITGKCTNTEMLLFSII